LSAHAARVGDSLKSRAFAIAALLAAMFAVGALTACGGSDSASESEIEQAREEGAEQARQSERIQQLQKEVKKLDRGKGSSSGGSAPAPVTGSAPSGATGSCGSGVSVGPNTSCPFALNVAETYYRTGSSVIDVYSPTTGETYTMTCSSGSPHVCTGGNDASVYFP